MPTIRSVSPSAAISSTLDEKMVMIRCGGAGTVTVRPNASVTLIGCAAAVLTRINAAAIASIARPQRNGLIATASQATFAVSLRRPRTDPGFGRDRQYARSSKDDPTGARTGVARVMLRGSLAALARTSA